MRLKGKIKELSIFISIIFMLSLFVLADIGAKAENIRIGTVINLDTGSKLNFRSGPGTGFSIIGSLVNGQSGEILDEEEASNGVLWYQMKVDNLTGWASSAYIKVTEQSTVVDKDFQTYLTKQGFPESYHAGLMALHNRYPNWKFEAQITNLDWNDVIEEESVLGKNLTHTSNPSSWKSIQNGAYNWTTGTWIGFDSSSWVAASTEIIQYYMDPRNFLDENYIFQFVKQSYDANDTSYNSNLTDMVKNTFLAGTYDENVVTQNSDIAIENGDSEAAETAVVTKSYITTILEAGRSAGVSPYTIATMIIQEQGVNGTGGSISGKEPGYEGYYNYFNVGAYAVNGLTAVQKGLQYASTPGSYGRPWDTRTKSIMGGAQYYGQSYIQKGQDTIYLKKYNVQGDNLYNHQYMTNVQGAASEGYILSQAYDAEARKASLTFKIPVYKNMPTTACTKPTGNGSPNYMLQSLAVSGQSLTPTFSMYDTEYSVIVENEVSSVTISAKAYDTNAVITGTGTKKLSVGENKLEVVVKAQNGAERTYIITILRKEAEVIIPPTTVTSSMYKMNDSAKTITGIKSFPVSASDFAKRFTVSNGTMKIFKADGTLQTGNVGTGTVVKIYDKSGALKYTYQVIIYGDASGDGRVNAQDLLVIQKNNIRISILEGMRYTAADVNRDNKVNAQDLLLVQKHNIRIKEIEQ